MCVFVHFHALVAPARARGKANGKGGKNEKQFSIVRARVRGRQIYRNNDRGEDFFWFLVWCARGMYRATAE